MRITRVHSMIHAKVVLVVDGTIQILAVGRAENVRSRLIHRSMIEVVHH